MALRICLVTPFSWSQPHDVNEHVTGVAAALRELGHTVTVLAPSNRGRDLVAGRRALHEHAGADLIALGPAVPVSRRSTLGVPVGVRTNLQLALEQGGYDVVHGFEPGLPSLSYLALRDARGLTVATFISPDRLGYPPAKNQRLRLLTRLDALVATSPLTAAAAQERFPGEYHVVPLGVDTERFAPAKKRNLVVAEWRTGERLQARSVARALADAGDWELVFLRTKPLSNRPPTPRRLAGRVRVRTLRDGAARAPLFAETAIFVPSPEGLPRALLEAKAAGAAIVAPPGVAAQPELAGAAVARLLDDAALRERQGKEARRDAERESFAVVARELDGLYAELPARRRPVRLPARESDDDRIIVDLHMHTSWSHDCTIPPAQLLDHAEDIGLGAIAVTDHNVFGGALETAELARGRPINVIPGEEVKTDGQGEVIGLFLHEEIPRGMSFAATIAAIRAQDGVVYLPHPFDRLHAIADPATLHRHLGDIDVFEVYNARLLFETYNDEALRFARKYHLTMGAGSDAHVLQGVGTGALRMRPFDGPQEFLASLETAEVLRRPKSLAYLQSLKWVAQVKDRLGAGEPV